MRLPVFAFALVIAVTAQKQRANTKRNRSTRPAGKSRSSGSLQRTWPLIRRRSSLQRAGDGVSICCGCATRQQTHFPEVGLHSPGLASAVHHASDQARSSARVETEPPKAIAVPKAESSFSTGVKLGKSLAVWTGLLPASTCKQRARGPKCITLPVVVAVSNAERRKVAPGSWRSSFECEPQSDPITTPYL